MSRTEELTTKLRILSYDHERLLSMHRNATEKAANAEREMNLHKSRLTYVPNSLIFLKINVTVSERASNYKLQAMESSHRHTVAELQRTRTNILGIRATHQSELKKKEKDIERMAEKWSKIADAQSKVVSIPSGMRCGNVAVVDGSEFFGKGQGFLEVALEEAEKSQKHLTEENDTLRKLVLTAVNEIQTLLHQAGRQPTEGDDTVRPSPRLFSGPRLNLVNFSPHLSRSQPFSLFILRGTRITN